MWHSVAARATARLPITLARKRMGAVTTAATLQRRSFTSSSNNMSITYVHPLSQIVLDHLQNAHKDWVIAKGADQGLVIREDGTIELSLSSSDVTTNQGGDIVDASTTSMDRIWTSYDPEEKKHWLTVHKGDLVGRYLLQDNLKPAWQSDRLSVPEKIQKAVDDMILKIEQAGV